MLYFHALLVSLLALTMDHVQGASQVAFIPMSSWDCYYKKLLHCTRLSNTTKIANRIRAIGISPNKEESIKAKDIVLSKRTHTEIKRVYEA